jgi:hypothetical protein
MTFGFMSDMETDGIAKEALVPRRSSMPDLSVLFRKNILTLLLAQVFQRAGAKDYAARAFQTTLVRVTDKALEDYELARLAFHEFVTRPNNSVWSPLFRATGHMENCLSSLERLFRLTRRLLEHSETSDLVRSVAALAPSARKRISTLRNAMEHIDERLVNEKIKEGDLTMLFLGEDAIELQGVSVSYAELAQWLTELHGLAGKAALFGTKQDAEQSVQPDRREDAPPG